MLFFFFKQKTAYEMRISDWSSDVCSSDLLESLKTHLPEIRRIRFWMTFGDAYLKHLEVLQNVGMTRIDPVMYEGREIIPLQFLKAVLPEPASLGETTKGKTNIGDIATGQKDGQQKTRSEERRLEKECVSTCRSRWPP